MKIKLLILIVFLINGKTWCQESPKIEEIFKLKIEQSLISSGDNFPDFWTEKDSLDKLLFAIHKGLTIADFQNHTKFNDEKMQKILSFLESKNWLHKVNNIYKPTVFIADANDGKLLYHYAKPISSKITKLINKKLPLIKKEFNTTKISQNDNFPNWSFLILSDVLLDSWQIDNVEKYFLKKEERPLRNGKYYYYKISENTNDQIESFGIYGNQTQQIDGKYVSVYGNNRLSLTLKSSKNIISKEDNLVFDRMAKNFLPDLLDILEKKRNYCEKIYKKLGYDKEITFEEFFIWWYHFIYTQATNQMSEKKMLQIPSSGNFEYLVEE